VQEFPHDPGAWTQGFAFEDGFFYEGTGEYKNSTLRRVVPENGKSQLCRRLADRFYGEGMAIMGDRIFQLTWQDGMGFVYRKSDFSPVKTFAYAGEGWGLTHDGKNLIMSDGTEVLRFIDPVRFREIRQIPVHKNGVPVKRLNELEYIDGKIWANVWRTRTIVIIRPDSGGVDGEIDLSGLKLPENPVEGRPPDVLNGIAWDPVHRRLFVTGKLWSRIFEIKLVPR